jgi:beta-glucosidase
MDWTTGAAGQNDATIAVLGLSGLLEGEEGAAIASSSKGDRIDLNLPEDQLIFLRKLRENNDKPLIIVLTGGSPIATPEIEKLADAILWVWYPGQQGGAAVADAIFGDISPSGRLPITFPASVDQLPPYEDYSMEGRTYKYMTEKPLYPFGYGLSYTRFEYGEPQLSARNVKSGDPLEVSVAVANTGQMDSTEIVQLYITSNSAEFDVPISTLIGFQPVDIAAGEKRSVAFTVAPEQMDVFDNSGERQRVKGTYTLHVGGVSPGARGQELTGTALKTVQFNMQ